MNEIVPESPEKDSDFDDENAYVPETPQKNIFQDIRGEIPIPSLERIRINLGVLNNNLKILSPTGGRQIDKNLLNETVKSSHKNYKKRKLSLLKKVKVSLFHDKSKKDESKVKEFSLNTKQFYGTFTETKKVFPVAIPDTIKPKKKQKSTKAQKTKSYNSVYRQSLRKLKQGVINCGVSHGIRKPKRSKQSSLKDNSVHKTKQNKSLNVYNEKQKENKIEGVIHSQFENIECNINKYNPTKKFFKYGHDVQKIPALLKKPKPLISAQTIEEKPFFISKLKNDKEGYQIGVAEKSNFNTFEEDFVDNYTIENENNDTGYPRITDSKNWENINDLLKILDEDWADDEYSKEVVSNTTMKSQCDTNYIFKDKLITSVIENIYTSTAKNYKEAEHSLISKHVDNKCYPFFSNENWTESVFGASKQKSEERNQNIIGSSKHKNMKNECQLDAGEKMFRTECQDCNTVHCIRDKNAENTCLTYCSCLQNIKFEGSNEHTVFEDPAASTRIIVVEATNTSLQQKKIMKVFRVINDELNHDETDIINYEDKKIYFYIENETVVGVLVAENVPVAYRMIPELFELNCCTSEGSPVKCGINLVWTARGNRRKGIATKLINTLRTTYYGDYMMPIDDIAFSLPTSSSKSFIKNYTKIDNFKVY